MYECYFSHPPERPELCKDDSCDMATCRKVHHPSRIPCKFGYHCKNKDQGCQHIHPDHDDKYDGDNNDGYHNYSKHKYPVKPTASSMSSEICLNGKNCMRYDCYFSHPSTRPTFCDNERDCTDPMCGLIHHPSHPRVQQRKKEREIEYKRQYGDYDDEEDAEAEVEETVGRGNKNNNNPSSSSSSSSSSSATVAAAKPTAVTSLSLKTPSVTTTTTTTNINQAQKSGGSVPSSPSLPALSSSAAFPPLAPTSSAKTPLHYSAVAGAATSKSQQAGSAGPTVTPSTPTADQATHGNINSNINKAEMMDAKKKKDKHDKKNKKTQGGEGGEGSAKEGVPAAAATATSTTNPATTTTASVGLVDPPGGLPTIPPSIHPPAGTAAAGLGAVGDSLGGAANMFPTGTGAMTAMGMSNNNNVNYTNINSSSNNTSATTNNNINNNLNNNNLQPMLNNMAYMNGMPMPPAAAAMMMANGMLGHPQHAYGHGHPAFMQHHGMANPMVNPMVNPMTNPMAAMMMMNMYPGGGGGVGVGVGGMSLEPQRELPPPSFSSQELPPAYSAAASSSAPALMSSSSTTTTTSTSLSPSLSTSLSTSTSSGTGAGANTESVVVASTPVSSSSSSKPASSASSASTTASMAGVPSSSFSPSSLTALKPAPVTESAPLHPALVDQLARTRLLAARASMECHVASAHTSSGAMWAERTRSATFLRAKARAALFAQMQAAEAARLRSFSSNIGPAITNIAVASTASGSSSSSSSPSSSSSSSSSSSASASCTFADQLPVMASAINRDGVVIVRGSGSDEEVCQLATFCCNLPPGTGPSPSPSPSSSSSSSGSNIIFVQAHTATAYGLHQQLAHRMPQHPLVASSVLVTDQFQSSDLKPLSSSGTPNVYCVSASNYLRLFTDTKRATSPVSAAMARTTMVNLTGTPRLGLDMEVTLAHVRQMRLDAAPTATSTATSTSTAAASASASAPAASSPRSQQPRQRVVVYLGPDMDYTPYAHFLGVDEVVDTVTTVDTAATATATATATVASSTSESASPSSASHSQAHKVTANGATIDYTFSPFAFTPSMVLEGAAGDARKQSATAIEGARQSQRSMLLTSVPDALLFETMVSSIAESHGPVLEMGMYRSHSFVELVKSIIDERHSLLRAEKIKKLSSSSSSPSSAGAGASVGGVLSESEARHTLVFVPSAADAHVCATKLGQRYREEFEMRVKQDLTLTEAARALRLKNSHVEIPQVIALCEYKLNREMIEYVLKYNLRTIIFCSGAAEGTLPMWSNIGLVIDSGLNLVSESDATRGGVQSYSYRFISERSASARANKALACANVPSVYRLYPSDVLVSNSAMVPSEAASLASEDVALALLSANLNPVTTPLPSSGDIHLLGACSSLSVRNVLGARAPASLSSSSLKTALDRLEQWGCVARSEQRKEAETGQYDDNNDYDGDGDGDGDGDDLSDDAGAFAAGNADAHNVDPNAGVSRGRGASKLTSKGRAFIEAALSTSVPVRLLQTASSLLREAAREFAFTRDPSADDFAFQPTFLSTALNLGVFVAALASSPGDVLAQDVWKELQDTAALAANRDKEHFAAMQTAGLAMTTFHLFSLYAQNPALVKQAKVELIYLKARFEDLQKRLFELGPNLIAPHNNTFAAGSATATATAAATAASSGVVAITRDSLSERNRKLGLHPLPLLKELYSSALARAIIATAQPGAPDRLLSGPAQSILHASPFERTVLRSSVPSCVATCLTSDPSSSPLVVFPSSGASAALLPTTSLFATEVGLTPALSVLSVVTPFLTVPCFQPTASASASAGVAAASDAMSLSSASSSSSSLSLLPLPPCALFVHATPVTVTHLAATLSGPPSPHRTTFSSLCAQALALPITPSITIVEAILRLYLSAAKASARSQIFAQTSSVPSSLPTSTSFARTTSSPAAVVVSSSVRPKLPYAAYECAYVSMTSVNEVNHLLVMVPVAYKRPLALELRTLVEATTIWATAVASFNTTSLTSGPSYSSAGHSSSSTSPNHDVPAPPGSESPSMLPMVPAPPREPSYMGDVADTGSLNNLQHHHHHLQQQQQQQEFTLHPQQHSSNLFLNGNGGGQLGLQGFGWSTMSPTSPSSTLASSSSSSSSLSASSLSTSSLPHAMGGVGMPQQDMGNFMYRMNSGAMAGGLGGGTGNTLSDMTATNSMSHHMLAGMMPVGGAGGGMRSPFGGFAGMGSGMGLGMGMNGDGMGLGSFTNAAASGGSGGVVDISGASQR